MWKLTANKNPKGQQEMKVMILVKDMAKNTYATYHIEFENHFKERVKEIKKTNNFSAELMFSVTPRNQKSVEVWKMKADGEFNYKLCTLDYID